MSAPRTTTANFARGRPTRRASCKSTTSVVDQPCKQWIHHDGLVADQVAVDRAGVHVYLFTRHDKNKGIISSETHAHTHTYTHTITKQKYLQTFLFLTDAAGIMLSA